jgi:hypothetical protein
MALGNARMMENQLDLLKLEDRLRKLLKEDVENKKELSWEDKTLRAGRKRQEGLEMQHRSRATIISADTTYPFDESLEGSRIFDD